jgi:hypothetical protein
LATLLVRDFGRSWLPGCEASDALEAFFASDATVVAWGGLAVDLLYCDVAIFLAFVVPAVLARLAGRSATELALATEAVVGAVAAAGRRADLVGDRGRTLLLGEVGDRSFRTPLLVGTASEAFGLLDCATFGPDGAKDLRSGLGKDGDRRVVFEVVFPASCVLACLGEETFLWDFGEVGVFSGGLFGVVGGLVETGRGRTRPPGGRTDIAFLLAMKFPLGGGSFRASVILVVGADCEGAVGFASDFGFVAGTFCATEPTSAASDEGSNAEPFSMTPKPPSTAAGFRVIPSAPPPVDGPPTPLVSPSADGRCSRLLVSRSWAVFDAAVPSSCALSMSAIAPTSLAFLSPHCRTCPASAGRSTATKLALTLLTGRLEREASEPTGDRPRLGGDVDVVRSLVLFSNIARRFRTPLLLVDMTMRFEWVSDCLVGEA